MAVEILAVGTSAASSADFVFTGLTTVGLKTTGGSQIMGGSVRVEIKGDDNNYYPFGRLSKNAPVLSTLGAGTYRFSREASSFPVGAFHG